MYLEQLCEMCSSVTITCQRDMLRTNLPTYFDLFNEDFFLFQALFDFLVKLKGCSKGNASEKKIFFSIVTD